MNISDYHKRKAERTKNYLEHVHGKKVSSCIACSGSGYYDHNGSPPCGECNGTGVGEHHRPKNPLRRESIVR
jgi:DnaJ-class molecular chaperone